MPSYKTYKRKKHLKKKILLITLLIFLISIGLNIYIYSNLNALKNNTQSLVHLQENLRRNLFQLIDDSKEIRSILSLPKLLYEYDEPFEENEGTEDSETERDSTNFTQEEILIQQTDNIVQKYVLDKISRKYTTIISEYNLETIAKKYNFELQQKNTALLVRYKHSIIATIKLLYNNNYIPNGIQYESNLIGTEASIEIANINDIFNLLHTKLINNISKAKDIYNKINILLNNKQNTLLFLSHNAKWELSSLSFTDTWKIYNLVDQEISYITLNHLNLDLKMDFTSINSEKLNNKQIMNTIQSKLLAINFKTYEDTITESNINLLKKYVTTRDFRKQINSLGLEISTNPRETSDYYYFDITTISNNTKVGAFSIQKNNGNFWTSDKDDVPIVQTNIFNFAPSNMQTKLTQQNIVLVGSHNGLADTIIIAHINENKKIKLISIPRDLYFEGRKINWYFKKFNPINFNKLLSHITGIPITQYVHVDMYAFISIIDILGGIQVTLENDLIDTDYKIKQNGKMTYLQYFKGDHYLSGIEVLRVARSRYSTNDFDRGNRQQAILEGIQKKLNSVDKISSFMTVLKIIGTIKPYISTNISSFELTQMIQKYRGANISHKTVISTKNILYSTYSNMYEKKSTKEELLKKGLSLGQWILLPSHNDWNNLQNYIKTLIMY